MTEFRTIAHVCFKVADMARSKAFYVDGLGFEELYNLTFGDVLARVEIDRAAGTLPADLDDAALAFLAAHASEVWSAYLRIAPGQFLELFVSRPGNTPLGDLEERIGYQHFALEVDDLEATLEQLQGRGVQAEDGIHVGPDNTKQVWLVDPDGNRIEVQQYTPESLQIVHGGLTTSTAGTQL